MSSGHLISTRSAFGTRQNSAWLPGYPPVR
jgi:hypothetical protein